MSRRNSVLLFIAVLSSAFLAGCGSSSPEATPPPTGNFTNNSLHGTYVFSIVGSDAQGNFIAITGTFTANGTGGNGGITGGAVDINDPNFLAPVRNSPITGGNYTVTPDGRGRATLVTSTFPTWIPTSNITVVFVLTSSQHGFITEFDGNGSGSGTLDLQIAANQPAPGTYVFGLSGISDPVRETPLVTAGAVTLDGSGNATGSLDFNNNEIVSFLTLNSGSSVLVGGPPGTAVLNTAGGIFNFDIYAIDSTHLKFIETDAVPILTGDLFSQTSDAFPTGPVVFTMAGFDLSTSLPGPVAIGGLMMSDGTSTITQGKEDFDDAGTVDSTPQGFSGTIAASSGRYVLQLNNFVNSAGPAVASSTFAAYPSSGGIELVEIDGNGDTAGVAFSQTSASLTSAQGYGLNLSGSNGIGREEDDIAEFITTSNGLNGLIDSNNLGQTQFDQTLTATYSMDSPATGRGVLTANNFSGPFYVVNSSNVLLVEADGATHLGLGAFQRQNATAASNLAASHLAVLRLQAGAKKVWHNR